MTKESAKQNAEFVYKHIRQTFYLAGMMRIIRRFSFFALLCMSASLFGQEKPNIIVFIADDISYNDFGCYGHPVIKTPNIDGLARNGLRFTNAFLTTSSCSPSRNSIITGRYPHNTGAAELHTPLPDNQIPFPRLLRQAGYYTTQAGKWHFGPFPPKPGDAMHGAFDHIGGHAGDGGGPSGSERWVEYVEQRPRSKPFFMWFAALDAHRGWDEDFAPVTYNPAEVIIPPTLRDTPETRRDLADYYREVSRFDHFIGKVVAVLDQQNALENTIILVMADNGRPFPRNKTRLYDDGIKTPLVIHWPGGIQHKGQASGSLLSAIDIAPTLLDVANVSRPDAVQGRSFRTLFEDPYQKFRNYIFAEHNWHDFMAFERMVRTERYLYIENGLPQKDNRGAIDIMGGDAGQALQRGLEANILTHVQRQIFDIPQPVNEFYDCHTDSLQVRNIAGTASVKKEERKLARILSKWKTETGDTQPENVTRDWYDRITNRPLEEKGKRGRMPGADKQAETINHSGPF